MRLFKFLLAACAVVLTLLATEVVLRPPTDREAAILHEAEGRSDFAQMRLARLILAVDEERGSLVLASITGTDPQIVKSNLERIGRIDMLPSQVAPQRLDGSRDDRTNRFRSPNGSGGARFVKVN